MTTIAEDDRRVIAGVDTHKEFHVGVVLDDLGRKLDTATFPPSGETIQPVPPTSSASGVTRRTALPPTSSTYRPALALMTKHRVRSL